MNTIDYIGDIAATEKLIDKSITEFIDDALTIIGINAFYNCSSLTSVDFPAATLISSSAFSGCSSLASVNFPTATSIYEYAFRGCTNLTSVDFPLVTSINSNAFNSCRNLTSVILRANQVATLSSTNAFPSNTIIYVPDDLVDQYKVANNWSTIADRIKGISELPS